jgi:hypothetical protein
MNRRRFLASGSFGLAGVALSQSSSSVAMQLPSTPTHVPRSPLPPDFLMPKFELVQPELFSLAGGQTNCWADFDGDNDLDLFVGFKEDIPNRLYRNDGGTFVEVGSQAGIADLTATRGTGWGDFDADGRPDIFVGFSHSSGVPGKLYHNLGNGKFVDVAGDLGIHVVGETRQISWIDFDNDGRLDLFVALRDAPNLLFHNEGTRFTEVGKDMGIADPRKTVGSVWFDFNQDGRLDCFTANQEGTLDGLFRNDGGKFVDVAHEMNMDQAGRPADHGSCGPTVIDYNNDGLLDLFVAGYGQNLMYRNEGNGSFRNVAPELNLFSGDNGTPSTWGDYDNDGRPDLYVSSYIIRVLNEHDHMYHNAGDHFSEVVPWEMLRNGATHGIQWADFDGNGALGIAMCNNNPNGHHYLWRNLLPPERAGRSLQVMVLDKNGHATKPGSEVRIFEAGTRTCLGTRIIDTGGGYCSQNIMPVHFGLPKEGPVDVEVTSFGKSGRQTTQVAGVSSERLPNRVLNVRVP